MFWISHCFPHHPKTWSEYLTFFRAIPRNVLNISLFSSPSQEMLWMSHFFPHHPKKFSGSLAFYIFLNIHSMAKWQIRCDNFQPLSSMFGGVKHLATPDLSVNRSVVENSLEVVSAHGIWANYNDLSAEVTRNGGFYWGNPPLKWP